MYARTNRGMGDTVPGFPGAQVIQVPGYGTGITPVGVQTSGDPVPAGTYQAALDQLPFSSPPSPDLAAAIAASTTPVLPPVADSTMSWLPWAAGALFLVLFVPLITHGGRR
jgi:hypothetical protein